MGNSSALGRFKRSKSFALLIVLIAVIAGFEIVNRNYLSDVNISNILNACSISGIISIGIGVALIGGYCDLSAGAVGCMGGVIIAFLLQSGMPWVPALLIVLIFGMLAGLINAFFTFVFNITPFIGTLAMASVWKGIAHAVTNSTNVSITNQAFWKLGSITVLSIPLPFIIMVLAFAIYGFFLSSTSYGRIIYMVGGNSQAARLAGIDTKKTGTILMINSGAISALAGTILAARMHTASPQAVIGTEFDAITAAVLGGISFAGGSGNMLGCFFGLLLLNAFSNGLVGIGLDSYWQIVASGVLLIVALTIDYLNERSRLIALGQHAQKQPVK